MTEPEMFLLKFNVQNLDKKQVKNTVTWLVNACNTFLIDGQKYRLFRLGRYFSYKLARTTDPISRGWHTNGILRFPCNPGLFYTISRSSTTYSVHCEIGVGIKGTDILI